MTWQHEERPMRALKMNRRSSLTAGGGGVCSVILFVNESFLNDLISVVDLSYNG